MKMRKFNIPFVIWEREAEDGLRPLEDVRASEIESKPNPGIKGGPSSPIPWIDEKMDDNSSEAGMIRSMQSSFGPRLPHGERQFIDPDNPPLDCPRCEGVPLRCPMNDKLNRRANWRACAHAM